MPDLTTADALRLAINVLLDSAESQKMPSGFSIDRRTTDLHADTADILTESLDRISGRE